MLEKSPPQLPLKICITGAIILVFNNTVYGIFVAVSLFLGIRGSKGSWCVFIALELRFLPQEVENKDQRMHVFCSRSHHLEVVMEHACLSISECMSFPLHGVWAMLPVLENILGCIKMRVISV